VIARNKSVVRAYYEGAQRGDISGFGKFLHQDFVVEAPNYLRWGGSHRAEHFLQVVLTQVASVLDFSRFSYESITAEHDRVAALINVGVVGSDAMIKISEHWLIKDERALSLWVAYYEPQALMERSTTSDSEVKRAGMTSARI
jgi:ketosteroid isomerase-like protein